MNTLADYWMGRDVTHATECSMEYRVNAQLTLDRSNALLARFGESRRITSGWRPRAINQSTPGAAIRSKHLTCQAVDLEDADGDLDEWALENQGVLKEIGLWQEHPAATKNWAHFQTVPPKSGNRVFYP